MEFLYDRRHDGNGWQPDEQRPMQQDHDTTNHALRHCSHVGAIMNGGIDRLLANVAVAASSTLYAIVDNI